MTPTDSPTPTPKPKHPLRRLALCLLFLALALVLAHAAWGHLAQRRLDARLRHLHAAGQPIYPADFTTPTLPAGQNAADDLIAASEILKRPDAIPKSFDHIYLGLPLTPAEIQTITDTLAARADVLALADAAAKKPHVHWDIDPAAPTVLRHFPALDGVREIANLLRADALLAHQQGRDDHALDRIEQILQISRHVDHQPAVVSHLVATSLAYLACQTADDIAPDLRTGTAPGHVPPARLRALIDQLLDDATPRAGMTLALRAERKDAPLIVTQVLSGQISSGIAPTTAAPGATPAPSLQGYALRPVFLNDADTMVRAYTTMLDGLHASQNLPAYTAAVDIPRQFPEIDAHPALHIFSSLLLPSGSRLMTNHFRILTDRHLAATALALRAYAADHANQLPPALDALIPTYLPAVPTDPLAPAGAKLHFRPTTPDPILYSVGEDATDNAGDPNPTHQTQRPDDRPLDRWEMLDAVLHLTRQPRYIPPPEEDPQP